MAFAHDVPNPVIEQMLRVKQVDMTDVDMDSGSDSDWDDEQIYQQLVQAPVVSHQKGSDSGYTTPEEGATAGDDIQLEPVPPEQPSNQGADTEEEQELSDSESEDTQLLPVPPPSVLPEQPESADGETTTAGDNSNNNSEPSADNQVAQQPADDDQEEPPTDNVVVQYLREYHPNYYRLLAEKYESLPRPGREGPVGLLPAPPNDTGGAASTAPPTDTPKKEKEIPVPVEKCEDEVEAERLAREIFKHSKYQEKIKSKTEVKNAGTQGAATATTTTTTAPNKYSTQIYTHLSIEEKRRMAICRFKVQMRQSKNPVVRQSSWKEYGEEHCMAERILKNCGWSIPRPGKLSSTINDWHAATELRNLWFECCRAYGIVHSNGNHAW